MIRSSWKIFLLLFLPYFVYSFPPQIVPGETSWSVKDIIKTAVLRSTIQFIEQYGYVNNTGQGYYQMLQDFFGSDSDSQEHLYETISELAEYANGVKTTEANSALHHANGEQIEMAHNHVRSLTSQIRTHIQNTPSPDVDILRTKIGQAMYTIISFYSNTNWVEMNGNTVYSDFGKDNVVLMDIADYSTPTCSDCGFSAAALEGGSCKGNLKDTGKLTSGYKSGQDMMKLVLYGQTENTGKCSHGSPDDMTRNQTATGGIYKGRSKASEAPHSHLHVQAALAAVSAVQEYIVAKDGMIDILGQAIFEEVFGMKRRSESQKASLVLVIDDTGSMGDDIVEVKEQLTKEVTLLTDDKLPQNFILVTFNDPVYYGTESVTESKTEILSKIDAIIVGGGWDCPEYSIDGAIRGATLALNNSQLWLFTDANAKDHGREDELVALLQAKNIIIHEFLRDSICITKSKRSVGSRTKRSAGYDVYQSVAMRTGGSFSIGSISQIGDWIRNLFRVYFPSSTAMIHYASIATSDSNLISIPVDTSVTLLKIEVIGTTTSSDVGLQYINGTVVDFASTANIKTTTSTAVILSLTSLTAGELILQRHVNNPWQVNITAQTDVDFKVALLRYHSDGLLYTETVNPLIGKRYAIAVEIYNLSQNSSISNISLADSDGKLVLSTDAVGSIDEFYGYYIGDLIINNQTDFVIIDGTDQYGYPIRRTSSFPIKPTNVELFVEELTMDLIINQVENITYTLTSHDAPNETYVVNITDDKGYVIEPSIFEHVLETNETVSGSFQVLGTTASSVVMYFITLQTVSSGEIIQQIKRKLLVSSVERPVCVLTSLNGSCSTSVINSANCSYHDWTAKGEVQYDGVPLQKIDLLNGVTSTKLNFNNASLSRTSGPLHFNISADCCSPRVFIQAVDTDGFYTMCKIEFTTSYILNVWTTQDSDRSERSDISVLTKEAVLSIAVIGGIVTCAVVLVVVFTVIIIVRIHTKQTPKQKVTDSFITLPDKADIGKPPIDFKEKLARPPSDFKEKLEIIEL